LDYYFVILIHKIGDKEIRTLIFLWLHNQSFYKKLQAQAVEPIGLATSVQSWADIGCSTGLMSRLAQKLDYSVTGYDINAVSLFLAKILSYRLQNIHYKNQDFYTIDSKFDRVTATSLLSVVEDKKEALNKLTSLLKDQNSTLIIIEPTEKLSIANTWKLISNLKTFWEYKGLLLWAKARENKAIDRQLFEDLEDMKVSHEYYLEGMVCVSYVRNIN
jgi:2-polyprenyl-3-methyl-5-hydroxy-6-metoxy-1,4-benzoquinol methylase